MKNRRFIFKKDYVVNDNGVFKKGSQLDLVEGRLFIQNGVYGGPIFSPIYENLMRLIQVDETKHEYLKEVVIPVNKA